MRKYYSGLLLLLVFAVPALCGAFQTKAQAVSPARSADQTFRTMADQFLDDVYFRYNPSLATAAGDHRYDSRLEDFSKDSVEGYLGALRASRKRLDEIKAGELSPANQIDLTVLKNAIDQQLYQREKLEWLTTHPEYYTQILLRAIYPLAVDTSVPAEQRLRDLTARLRLVPGLINEAEKLIVPSPARELPYAAEHNLSVLRMLLEKGIPEQFAEVKDQKLQAEFRESNAEAQKAIRGFTSFFTSKGMLSRGSFNIGPAALSQLLVFDDMLTVPVPELLKIAEAEMQRIDAEMKSIAAKVAPGQSMRDAVDFAAGFHPSRPQLESEYTATLASLRQFIKQKSLLDLPEAPPPVVRLMPEWIYTVASRFPVPWRLNGLQPEIGTPTFYVSFGPTAAEVHVQLELSKHNYGVLTWRAIHDVYPGEYTERAVLNSRSRVRAVLGSRVSREGWDNYSVDMMTDAGYLPPALHGKPAEASLLKYRLLLLNQQLLRTAMMATALTSQVKDLRYEPGARYLGEHAYLGSEASWYFRAVAEDPLCFADTLGRLEIEKLKQDYRKAQGKNYSERKFNDAVLQMSGAPMALIRKALLGENSGPSL